MKSLFWFYFIAAHVILFMLVYFVITQKDVPPQKCISERALQGCEKAGFEIEHELERCMWTFSRCEQTNEVLQERCKETK